MEPDRNRCLPISEDFHSLQGEGRWVGTPMHFIRLAGCSVGQPPSSGEFVTETIPILKTGNPAWLCHTHDGRPFWCDTDFKFRAWGNFANLLDETWEQHICITGGEPLLHTEKLERFIEEAQARDIKVHVETSGTIEWGMVGVWISVSPKLDALDEMIQAADEIKLLVDDKFDLATLPLSIRNHPLVYIQPINNEMTLRNDNFDLCMFFLRTMPHWHMSVQMHKLVGLR